MLRAFRVSEDRLEPLGEGDDPIAGAWIDLVAPGPAELARVEPLGLRIPTLEDMEEIEISNRLYRDHGADYITVVLPGQSETERALTGPVTFILGTAHLVTVRHHHPRPFQTFPTRAETSASGVRSPMRLFLGLVEEVIARLADLLEVSGRKLDGVAAQVYAEDAAQRPDLLQDALEEIGRQSELVARVRLSLLTLERALVHVAQLLQQSKGEGELRGIVKARSADITALEVHADYLSGRVGLVTDASLGMITLSQNATARKFSLVAVIFLPPTLIASVWGMNFDRIPLSSNPWGFEIAVGMMVAAAVLSYLFFRWRDW